MKASSINTSGDGAQKMLLYFGMHQMGWGAAYWFGEFQLLHQTTVHLELTHYCSELQRSCSETSSYPHFHVHPVLILQQDNARLHTAGVCMQILQHSHINIMQ